MLRACAIHYGKKWDKCLPSTASFPRPWRGLCPQRRRPYWHYQLPQRLPSRAMVKAISDASAWRKWQNDVAKGSALIVMKSINVAITDSASISSSSRVWRSMTTGRTLRPRSGTRKPPSSPYTQSLECPAVA
jgi:hypothetical protein